MQKKRHVSFQKILQFRDIIRNVSNQAAFDGIDSDGEPIYNKNKEKPKILFSGTVKLHGCLHARTRILLTDGTRKEIKDIVDNKLDVEVFGMDKKGHIVRTKVINWFNTGKTDDWLTINFTCRRVGGRKDSSIRCTPNHEFYDPSSKKYIQAKNLSIGDDVQMIRNNMELSYTQEQILIGKMLGDGSLQNDNIVFGQKELNYVKETLKNLGNIGYTVKEPITKISGWGTQMFVGRTIDKFFIRELFEKFYTNGKRSVPKDVQLGPIAMAYWYMDDGSLAHNETQKDRALFATCRYSENSIDNLIDSFKHYGIHAIKYKTDEFWRLRLNTKDAYIFFNLVSPYIIPIMRYKLPVEFRDPCLYTNMIITDSEEFKDTCVQKILDIKNGLCGNWNEKKYDIETITHNFFANGVLVHNSNGSVVTNGEEVWYQSRKRIVTPISDNHNFSQFCMAREESFTKLLEQGKTRSPGTDKIVSIFGEYCGQGIANGTAISKLPRMFVIFALKVTIGEDSQYISPIGLSDPENQIYNIYDFETFNVKVDFNYPKLAQNKFVELVNYVENECPVGRALGSKGIGEGIVWTGYYDGIRHTMKTKGQKHSTSNTKTIAPVDVEKINSIREFVDYAVTNNRMEQAVEELFTSENKEPEIQQMGDFLRWIIKDIAKEEMDVLLENGLVLKDIGKYVSGKAKIWFQGLLYRNAGL